MCHMGIIETSEAMASEFIHVSTEIEMGIIAHDDFGAKIVL